MFLADDPFGYRAVFLADDPFGYRAMFLADGPFGHRAVHLRLEHVGLARCVDHGRGDMLAH